MTYWALNAVFLIPAAAVLVLALVRRTARGTTAAGGTRASGRNGVLAALAITAVVLLGLTAVFDNVMIASGLFSYNPDRISGAFIGSAPLEDFAYALAAVLLLPALWLLLEKKPKTAAAPSAAADTEEKQ